MFSEQTSLDLIVVMLTGKKIKSESTYRDALVLLPTVNFDNSTLYFQCAEAVLVVGPNIIALDIPGANKHLTYKAVALCVSDNHYNGQELNGKFRLSVPAKTKDIAERFKKSESLLQWLGKGSSTAKSRSNMQVGLAEAWTRIAKDFTGNGLKVRLDVDNSINAVIDVECLSGHLDKPHEIRFEVRYDHHQIQILFHKHPYAEAMMNMWVKSGMFNHIKELEFAINGKNAGHNMMRMYYDKSVLNGNATDIADTLYSIMSNLLNSAVTTNQENKSLMDALKTFL